MAESAVHPKALAYYVERYRVSDSEARRRLATQLMAPNLFDLLAERLGERLAHLSFDNGSGQWEVGVTDAMGAGQAASELDRLGLGDVSRVARSAYTAKQLREAQRDLVVELRDLLRAGQVAIGEGGGRLRIRVASDATAAERDRVTRAARGKAVTAEVQDAKQDDLAARPSMACAFPNCDTMMAGVRWWPIGCSTAFWVGYPGFDEFNFLTVGHCVASPGAGWNSCKPAGGCPTAGIQNGSYFDSGGDAGTLRVEAFAQWPMYAGYADWSTYPSPGVIRPVRLYYLSSASEGTVTCLSGATSGTHCGTVADSNATADYSGRGGPVAQGMLRVTGSCPLLGDSGGAWTQPGVDAAVGVQSGASPDGMQCGDDAFVEPVHRPLQRFGIVIYGYP